ncbi:MAG: MOSC domain-containing protein [Blastocatellia bacterium]|nr:MOSC domain-containing protein [Blastocatellia bacterium]
MRLSEISIYPIKSLGQLPLARSVVEGRGLRHDRRWMLVDMAGRFLTQREHPQMARVSIEVEGAQIHVSVPGAERIGIQMNPESSDELTVTVWGSTVAARPYSPEISGWFSTVLGMECRLVVMPETSKRPVNPNYAVDADDEVSFADGYPFLLIGERSLEDLNSRLERPVEMRRFRPNLVADTSEPFEEDRWRKIRIGTTIFHVVKPCARCVLTTVDPDRGVIDGNEPLRTLATYRKSERGVLFGQNLIAENPGGVINVGDEVEVLESA